MEAFVTAAERLTKEAAERARTETLARTVLKQLELKFGSLGSETVERVQQSTVEQLDTMVERVLTAKSVDEVVA
jgi:hypothetical protein